MPIIYFCLFMFFVSLAFHYTKPSSWRIGESGEWDQLPQIHTNNSITSYQMTGLLPFTIYSFRVLAVNSLGISLPSKESYYIVTLREGLYVHGSHIERVALSRRTKEIMYDLCLWFVITKLYHQPLFVKIFQSKFYCYNFMPFFPLPSSHFTSLLFTSLLPPSSKNIKRRNEISCSSSSLQRSKFLS